MKKRYVFLSFFIPFLGTLFALIASGIIFGDNSIYYADSQYQYQQLLFWLKNVFEGTSNISYSFQVGFGGPMLSTLAYYLLSPFNLFLSLFSYENIEAFFIIFVLIRVGLCGLTMYLYLTYQNKNKYALLFSTCYALSFHIVVNYFQMMWLDAYLLAPLLLLGIDKIIKEKKFLLYGLTLFLIILSNYYMGYMCAVFSVLYFVYKFILDENKDKKTIKIFLITSILCGLMTMFIHIPNLLYLMTIPRVDFRDYLFNTDILGILSKMYLGSNLAEGALNTYHPYLYIGLVNIILLSFYFINKNINKKEKILSLIIIIILILSVLIGPLNNFWHALSNPIGFNFRYMYLFNIFILSLCFKSFLNIKDIDKKWYYIVFLIFIILSNLIIIRDIMNTWYIYISVAVILIYLILLRRKDKDSKILFIGLIIAELFFNSYTVISVYNLTKRYYINGVYNEKNSTIEIINDDSFYRMEFYKHFAMNDPLNYGYYGVRGWLSSVDINMPFRDKIGYYSSNNMGYYNQSVVLDSLFGIKYYESIYPNDYYELIGNNKYSTLPNLLYGVHEGDTYIYKNPYALSLGYMVSERAKADFICIDGFICQSVMMDNMIGFNNDVYTVEKIENNTIKIKDTKDFYISINDYSNPVEVFEICIDDFCEELNIAANRSFYFKNDYNIGDEIKIKVQNDHYIPDIQIAYIDFDKLKENYEILSSNQLNITSFKENHIKGNITVEDNNVLFLSIPYEKGWNIYVDGEKIDYYKIFDYFIGLDLLDGYHEIEMTYNPPGVKLGIIISSISAVLFIGYIIYMKKHKD